MSADAKTKKSVVASIKISDFDMYNMTSVLKAYEYTTTSNNIYSLELTISFPSAQRADIDKCIPIFDTTARTIKLK